MDYILKVKYIQDNNLTSMKLYYSFLVKKCDYFCTQQYDPVCGTDYKTYGNGCMLSLATCKSSGKIQLKYKGRCGEEGKCMQIVNTNRCNCNIIVIKMSRIGTLIMCLHSKWYIWHTFRSLISVLTPPLRSPHIRTPPSSAYQRLKYDLTVSFSL